MDDAVNEATAGGTAEREVEALRARVAELEAELHAQRARNDVAVSEGRQALAASDQKFRELAENIGEVFWVLDVELGRVTYVSDAYRAVWGREPDEVYRNPKAYVDAIHPDDLASEHEAWQRRARGEVTTTEYRVLRPDGTVRWVRDRGWPVFASDGRCIRHVGLAQDITADRERVVALERSEQRFRTILDRLWEGVMLTDAEGVVRFVSNAETLVGRSAESIVGTRAQAQIHPDDAAIATDARRRCLAEPGVSQRFDARLRRADGSTTWGEFAMLNLLDDPAVGAVVAQVRDITDRRRADDALRTLNADLRKTVDEHVAELSELYNEAPCGYHSIDAEGVVQRMNDTELRWLGYERSEVVGRKRLADLLAPASRPFFEALLAGADASSRYDGIEYEMLRKDGTVFPVQLSVAKVHDAAGRFVKSRTSVFDVSERRRSERETRARERDLRDFLDSASDLVVFLDPAGRVTYANRAFCEALAVPSQDLASLTLADVLPPGADPVALLAQLGANGRQPTEVTLLARDGHAVLVEGTANRRVSADGHTTAIQAFLHDVTERRRAERALDDGRKELARAHEALTHASRTKDEFLAGMSHELRTPLHSVLGLSEALLEDIYGELPAEQRGVLQRIDDSGRHLLELINDLLDLTKVEAGMVELENTPVRLDELCRSSAWLVRGAAERKHQQVTLDVRDGDTAFLGDERRLKQVLVNLLGNAVKFVPKGGDLGLEARVDHDEGVVLFVVWDHGIGIAPEHVPRLFQPFVQLDSGLARKHEGTGLGLALVRRLVELHGGAVGVQSKPGEGTRFTVTLPLRRPG